ncbi:hypothetical protein O181_021655 [Austropuccinia psidii MF-1]|uniref:Telomerase reverse transcriptase n=1 Tax=Austropuccinia psidii MF-1 TaxID=1389203 RepID=A0A9Q3CF06_9BASI|nr:hypothetical protein [Austropuccinia psidii MF-1]
MYSSGPGLPVTLEDCDATSTRYHDVIVPSSLFNLAFYLVSEAPQSPLVMARHGPSKFVLRLLRIHHPHVTCLGNYLDLTDQGDNGKLLEQIVVGFDHQENLIAPHPYRSATLEAAFPAHAANGIQGNQVSMAQVIDAAQSILLWHSTRQTSQGNLAKQNVLILGCRMSNEFCPELAKPVVTSPFAHPLVSKHHVYDNTINKFLSQSFFFSDILQRIGAKTMVELLISTALYFPADNGCYFQLCGPPILELPVLCEQTEGCNANSLTQVVLAKNALMYTTAPRNKAGRITMGLVSDHILNQIHDNPDSLTSDHLKCIHLSKFVFPSQYGFHSFTLKGLGKAIQKQGGIKTPKRIKSLIKLNGLIHNIVIKSNSLKLKPILNRCCPSKFVDQNLNEAERLSFIELIQTSQLYDQSSSDDFRFSHSSTPSQLQFASSSQFKKPPSLKLQQFVCPHHEVQTFVRKATQAYGLDHWWGACSPTNRQVVWNNVDRIVKLRRFEKISMHELIQGFKLKECGEWLLKNPSDAKSRQMLQDFTWWFYFLFVAELIKNTFFITESAIFRNRILYFRLDDWERICHPLVDHLKTILFYKIDEQELRNSHFQLGHSSLRLLPKDNGVRPIINLKRKRLTQTGSSNNSVLQNLFTVLSYEKDASPEMMGASVLGLNHIYTRFKEFRSRLGLSIPKMYFVKVDIRACFDTIRQEKLLQVINDWFSEDQYVVQKYGKIFSAIMYSGKVFKQLKREAYPSDESPDFAEYVSKASQKLNDILFCDQVKYTYTEREVLMALLKEHITKNFVKIGAHTYQQKVGIPQGSILSPLLCSLFYADMDRKVLKFTNGTNSLLMRLIDDFLFVTASRTDAEHFLKVMAQGNQKYGCFVSPEKTLTNFQYHGVKRLVGEEFPWCGNLINTKTLEFKADLMRYNGIHLADTLTVDHTKFPGQTFRQKMYGLAKLRMNIIYLDTTMNSIVTVLLNIYQVLRLIAAKYVAYLNDWEADTVKGWKFFHDVIEKTIQFVCVCAYRQAAQDYVKKLGGTCAIDSQDIVWLGRYAFKTALQRRIAKFGLIIQRIEIDLARQKKNAHSRKTEARLRASKMQALRYTVFEFRSPKMLQEWIKIVNVLFSN